MSNETKIAISILAAGGSSRMGSPKQLLKWKGSNLINHTLSNAKQLKSEEIIVVLGANVDLIKPEIEHEKVRIVINHDWENGLGSSISEGVNYIFKSKLDIDGLLIMLADQPLIEYDHYLKLINSFYSGRKSIVATKYKDNNLGVPALFDKFYFNELRNLNSDFGAKQVISKYAENVISNENEKSRFDIDKPLQYQDLYRANH